MITLSQGSFATLSNCSLRSAQYLRPTNRLKLKFINLLLSTYWTMDAVRHADYVVKVRMALVQSFADRAVRLATEAAEK